MFRKLVALFAFALAPLTASAKMTCVQESLPMAQVSAGVHLSISGGKVGVGASVDALGGLGVGSWCAPMPGVVAGPFAEVNAVASEGATFTWGGRAAAGALNSADEWAFAPVGMAAFDYGQSMGARTGTRKGLRVRSSIADAACNWYDEGPALFTGGLNASVLPSVAFGIR